MDNSSQKMHDEPLGSRAATVLMDYVSGDPSDLRPWALHLRGKVETLNKHNWRNRDARVKEIYEQKKSQAISGLLRAIRENNQLELHRTLNDLVDVKGADAGAVLHAACRSGQVESVVLLLDAGFDPNCPHPVICHGGTPLHSTVIVGGVPYSMLKEDKHIKIAKHLLAAGANINATNNNGQTPLHLLACRPRAVKFAETLLKAGANPGIKDRRNEVPWHIVRPREKRMFKLLGEAYLGPIQFLLFEALSFTLDAVRLAFSAYASYCLLRPALPSVRTDIISPTLSALASFNATFPVKVMFKLLKNSFGPASLIQETPLPPTFFMNPLEFILELA